MQHPVGLRVENPRDSIPPFRNRRIQDQKYANGNNRSKSHTDLLGKIQFITETNLNHCKILNRVIGNYKYAARQVRWVQKKACLEKQALKLKIDVAETKQFFF